MILSSAVPQSAASPASAPKATIAPIAPIAPTSSGNSAATDSFAQSGNSTVDPQDVKKLFLELVKVPGRSFHERQIANTLKGKLADLGLQAKEDDAGKKIGGNSGNLLVDVPGNVKDAPSLIFLCHMDTVPLAQHPHIVEKDGVIQTDGTTALGGDDRSGDAEVLTMLKTLKDKNLPHPDMQIIFSVAEEAGLKGSKALNPKDVHGKLGFEADYFHPNQILWGTEWGDNGPAGNPEHPNGAPENFLEGFTEKAISDVGLNPVKDNLDDASSDSASLRQMGIPALIIGAGEQDVHTVDEHISVADLGKATDLMLKIVQNANNYVVDSSGAIVARGNTPPAATA